MAEEAQVKKALRVKAGRLYVQATFKPSLP
jgi:hypothetical protein